MTPLPRIAVMKTQIANLRAGVRSIHTEAIERKDAETVYRMAMIQSLLHDVSSNMQDFEESSGGIY